MYRLEHDALRASAQGSYLDPSSTQNGGGNTGSTGSTIGAKITEDLILYYTDCRKLTDVQVIALRDRNLTCGVDVLSFCAQLSIAFL